MISRAKKIAKKPSNLDSIERVAIRATRWIGSTPSLLVHTGMFLFAFLFYFWGFDINTVLLVLTTVVSLEAIYLSIFIQMSVNRQARRLHAVARDVEDIQEDVEEIQEDVEEIQEDVEGIEKDVDEIQKDVDEIQEDVEEIQEEEEEESSKGGTNKTDEVTLTHIQILLSQLAQDVKDLKDKHK
jgi:uncharacterized membrane protein